MPELPTEEDQALWDQYVGPTGRPRIVITAPTAEQPLPSEPTEFDNDPFVRAAERLRRRHQQFPIYGPPAPEKPPSYLIEPDLLEAQQGQHLPTNMAYNEAGIPFNLKTGEEIPTIRRPNILPVASTPEGLTFAMPKAMDIFGNLMGGVVGAPVKGAEVLLGSGPVRKVVSAVETEAPKFKMTPVNYDPFATDWYHGSVRIDRMDPKIDPKRATSGPMPFFTDDPAMASSYAMGKKPDTSLQAMDAGDSVANYFKVSPKDLGRNRERTPYTVEQSWYALKPEQKQEILDKYHKIGYKDRDMGEGPYTLHNEPYSGLSGKDHYEYILKNEAQGNPLKALRIIWHDGGSLINQEGDLAEIYKLAGYPHKISEATAPWVEARGIMAAKLNMKNPLITENKDVILNEILPKLEQAFKNDRTRKPAYSNTDMWDKNYRYTPKEWVAQAIEDYKKGDNSYVWTTIPDKVTAKLKKLGFDGILDTGGKGGGQAHKVAIPFDIPGIATSKYSGKTLYSDTRNQVYSEAGRQLEKGPFFSALEKAVDTAKVGKADAQQWLGYLKNQPGVKSEELAYVLKELPEGPITKEALSDLVKSNKIELKEVVKGGDDLYGDKANYALNEYRQELLNKYGNGIRNKATPEELKKLDDLDDITTKSNPNPTKYHSYQLPGGERYQEMLLTLPGKKPDFEQWLKAKSINLNDLDTLERLKYHKEFFNEIGGHKLDLDFKSSHWDEPNIIAHIRHNDRYLPDSRFDVAKQNLQDYKTELKTKYGVEITPHEYGKLNKTEYNKLQELEKNKDANVKGSKTLHLEEIQSDWHQKGRNEGYKLSDNQRKDLDAIEGKLTSKLTETEIGNPDIDNVLKVAVEKKVISADEARNYKDYVKGENSTVPDAPFKKNWDELALKRMLHKAATEGYEGISWTPGEAQAARYDLSKQVNLLSVMKQPDGKYLTYLEGKDSQPLFRNRDGFSDNGQKTLTAKELEDTVGKEVAKKAIEGKPNKEGWVDIRDKDLKIGGEGMKSFYDKMLVDKANTLAKKYGSKVEQRSLSHGKKIGIRQATDMGGGWEVYDIDGKILNRTNSLEDARASANEFDKQPIHYLPITPELRAKAKEGFPLFSTSPTLTAVQHDPFQQDQNKKYKLTPVDYDPFN